MNDSIDKALDDLDDLDFNESIVKVVFILKCVPKVIVQRFGLIARPVII